jgi:hypothetical protein
MSRRHTLNPTVTVIMETVGFRPEKMARAVRSFLAQEYDRAKLLILNYHPMPLRLVGVPAGARIEVMNERDVYLRHVYQHMHNLKQVDTDCWTILDDDDWIGPGHLSQLVGEWNKATDRGQAPLQVCGQNYAVHYDDGMKPLRFKGWAVSLFERLTPAEVDYVFKLFPADLAMGSDTWVAWNSYFDKRLFDGAATYHWDRQGMVHASAHEKRTGDEAADRFADALRWWGMKIAARERKMETVDLSK